MMKKENLIKRYFQILLCLLFQKTARMWPDKLYLKVMFKLWIGKELDLYNPKTYNEKCQWLKLYNRQPIYTTMVDKYKVKEYVKSVIGEEYLVPCLGVWNKAEEIDFNDLPEQFVLKCNHDSSSVTIVKSKKDIDIPTVVKKLNKCIKTEYYYGAREWPYKDVEHVIFAEQYLDDKSGHELRDYKFWCFNGVPIYMYITNKGSVVKENFYDMDFNPVDINHGFYRTVPEYEKPEHFEEMKDLATLLSKNIPFVRVDFFCVNGHVYFSEFTFFDWGGTRRFIPEKTDIILGDLIKLPPKTV